MNKNIGICVVTFNRIECLKKSLSLYDKQAKYIDYVIVVNNCSTDGTLEYLTLWEKDKADYEKYVITLDANLGCSGGNFNGLKKAMSLDADWIFIADDDGYIFDDTLANAKAYLDNCENLEEISAVASILVQKKGIHYPEVMRNTILGKRLLHPNKKELQNDIYKCDGFPYVGIMMKKDALLLAGLPRIGFFLYQDDYEHAIRLKKHGKIVCNQKMRVDHDGNSDFNPKAGWRDYYETRNALIIAKEYLGFWTYHMRRLTRLATSLRALNPEKTKVYLAAMKDAKKGKEGLHEIYRPGWTPKR